MLKYLSLVIHGTLKKEVGHYRNNCVTLGKIQYLRRYKVLTNIYGEMSTRLHEIKINYKMNGETINHW